MIVSIVSFGVILVVGSAILIIVDAFRKAVAWGLVCLFFPPSQLIFVALYWDDEKGRLLGMVIGFAIVFLASPYLPPSAATS